jgi:hypothetical protein
MVIADDVRQAFEFLVECGLSEIQRTRHSIRFSNGVVFVQVGVDAHAREAYVVFGQVGRMHSFAIEELHALFPEIGEVRSCGRATTQAEADAFLLRVANDARQVFCRTIVALPEAAFHALRQAQSRRVEREVFERRRRK